MARMPIGFVDGYNGMQQDVKHRTSKGLKLLGWTAKMSCLLRVLCRDVWPS